MKKINRKLDTLNLIKYLIIMLVIFAPITIELISFLRIPIQKNEIAKISLARELLSFAQLIYLFGIIRFVLNRINQIMNKKNARITFWLYAIVVFLLIMSVRIYNFETKFPNDYFFQSLLCVLGSSLILFMSYGFTTKNENGENFIEAITFDNKKERSSNNI